MTTLAIVDYIIIAILLLSALISILRGFMKEMISLATWVAAFVIGLMFSAHLAPMLPPAIEIPSMRITLAFLILFVLTLIVGGLINMLVGFLVKKTGLSGTDRSVGVVFGIARGVFIVAVLILLASLTPMPQDPWWRESLLIPQFQTVSLWIRELLPDDMAQHFVLMQTAAKS
ncbi:MAG: CvpA family protein [Halothiobacillaceae bacterium]|jgi:membrane protein required for colicin V production|nr:CvpA family protein [Halothiobacillaceae bacterium]MDY0050833.1 CvpA family protein [Halothiobacillaceae bacterium]